MMAENSRLVKRLLGLGLILAPFIWVLWSLISVFDWQGVVFVLSVVTGIVSSLGVGVWLLLAEEVD